MTEVSLRGFVICLAHDVSFFVDEVDEHQIFSSPGVEAVTGIPSEQDLERLDREHALRKEDRGGDVETPIRLARETSRRRQDHRQDYQPPRMSSVTEHIPRP